MKTTINKEAGFTLIEMLIVVIVLGILAMIIIPQINVSTGEAKLSTLRTNLGAIRNAIELYYHQHNNTYPGAVLADGTGPTTTAAQASAAFLQQLTQYSLQTGYAKADREDAGFSGKTILGPYLKTATLPQNPFNESNALACDIDTTTVTDRTLSAGGEGWKFFVKTGVFIANDSAPNAAY